MVMKEKAARGELAGPPYAMHSEDAKTRARMAMLGHHVSLETRAKIGAANRGEQNGMHGRGHDDEARRKISDAAKTMWADPEKRRQIVEKLNDPDLIRRNSDRAYAQGLQRRHESAAEQRISELLNSCGIEHKRHVPLYGSWGMFECDILCSDGLVVEIDGVYWHSYPWGRPIDRRRTSRMLASGRRLVRIWEHEARWVTEKTVPQMLLGIRPTGVLKQEWSYKLAAARRHAETLGHQAESTLDELLLRGGA